MHLFHYGHEFPRNHVHIFFYFIWNWDSFQSDYKNMEFVIYSVLTMLTSTHITTCKHFTYEQKCDVNVVCIYGIGLFDIFDAISVTDHRHHYHQQWELYVLFIQLNFGCQGNPLFDIFIRSDAFLSFKTAKDLYYI